MAVAINAESRAIAKAAVAQRIAELRAEGFEVEVIQDCEVVATIELTVEGEQVTMLIDPLGIVRELHRQRKLH